MLSALWRRELTRLAVALDARGHPRDDGRTRPGGKALLPAGALGRRRFVPPEHHLRSRTNAPLWCAQRKHAATRLAFAVHGRTLCLSKAQALHRIRQEEAPRTHAFAGATTTSCMPPDPATVAAAQRRSRPAHTWGPSAPPTWRRACVDGSTGAGRNAVCKHVDQLACLAQKTKEYMRAGAHTIARAWESVPAHRRQRRRRPTGVRSDACFDLMWGTLVVCAALGCTVRGAFVGDFARALHFFICKFNQLWAGVSDLVLQGQQFCGLSRTLFRTVRKKKTEPTLV